MKSKKKSIGIIFIVAGIGLLTTALIFAFGIDMKYTPYFMLSSIIINSVGVALVRSGNKKGGAKK